MNVDEVAPALERAQRAEDLAAARDTAGRFLEGCREAKAASLDYIAVSILASDDCGARTPRLSLGGPPDLLAWFSGELFKLVEQLHQRAADELAAM